MTPNEPYVEPTIRKKNRLTMANRHQRLVLNEFIIEGIASVSALAKWRQRLSSPEEPTAGKFDSRI